MPKENSYFTPSTNLIDDISSNRLLKNIILTNQVLSTVKLFSDPSDTNNNSAVSIVGPYGSGKSTTALFLYYYLIDIKTMIFQ